ncbi:hypothetical protein PENDEC_c022G03307 [Penicillium decumbens]|uniref:Uncharacterized protein n=1 Tax=Penicillium decumbens TaxID=69771 RepID=A0A1V6P0U3_PENDC|nr:hypothetical protein PENDEC_c022G03307 [Penicillium decumbens]
MPDTKPTTKPVLPPLQTPKSSSFPKSASFPLPHDDCPSSISDAIKQEEESLNPKSTPITPASSIPSVYKEFLDLLSPHFSAGVGLKSPYDSKSPVERSTDSPTSQPASALSSSFSFRSFTRSPTISLPPPTPAGRKGYPIPHRLCIPPSRKYYTTTDSPKSATVHAPPYSPYAPDELAKALYRHEPPHTAGGYPMSARADGKPVSVKHIVTRTVTWKRPSLEKTTKLEAPPKQKRRKCRELKEAKEV